MNDPRGQLDVTEGLGDALSRGRDAGRPWIQVWFACAGVYQRVFRSVDGSRYVARCAKCGKTMNFRVGEGGTNRRLFEVRC